MERERGDMCSIAQVEREMERSGRGDNESGREI
jgi:hypothetical protein